MLKSCPVNVPAAWPRETGKQNRPPAEVTVDQAPPWTHEMLQRSVQTRVHDPIERGAGKALSEVNDAPGRRSGRVEDTGDPTPDERSAGSGHLAWECLPEDNIAVFNELLGISVGKGHPEITSAVSARLRRPEPAGLPPAVYSLVRLPYMLCNRLRQSSEALELNPTAARLWGFYRFGVRYWLMVEG
jgi:hypothetical protein